VGIVDRAPCRSKCEAGTSLKFPPQHGAWAFLIVPAVIVTFLGAGNWIGLLFFLAWVSGYPVSYFLGRALISRIRKGTWTKKARKELEHLLPWLVINAIATITLISLRPWIISFGILVVALWSFSVYLSWAGRERGIINDLLLIGLASTAPILMYQAAVNHASLRSLPHPIWIAAMMSLLFFAGSVLHVKALIRESKNPKWHYGSIIYHGAAIGIIFVVTGSWILVIPFVLALLRAVVIKPGHRPGTLGVVELGVSISLIVCTVIATG
jgi:hypothetical protein